MSSRVILLEFTNPFQELLRSPLLKHSHQRRAQGLVCIRGDLGHVSLAALALLDVAASNLLELKISCNIGGNQDIRQLAVGHQQLGDQVDVPVVDPAILLPGLLAGVDVAVLLEQLETNTDPLAMQNNMTNQRATHNNTHSLDVHGSGLTMVYR